MTLSPDPVMAPTLALPFAMPSTVQVTAVSLLPVTVAVMDTVPPAATLAALGLSETATATGAGFTGGAWTVTVVEPGCMPVPEQEAITVWLPGTAGAT